MTRVTLVAGGVGGAKLAEGLAGIPEITLTVIGNVAEDEEFHGLWVSPDIDTMLSVFTYILCNETFLLYPSFSISNLLISINIQVPKFFNIKAPMRPIIVVNKVHIILDDVFFHDSNSLSLAYRPWSGL